MLSTIFEPFKILVLSGEFWDEMSVSGGTNSFSIGISRWVSSRGEKVSGFVGLGREGRVGVEEK